MPSPAVLYPRASSPLQRLLEQRPDLWRGAAQGAALPAGVPTGFAALE